MLLFFPNFSLYRGLSNILSGAVALVRKPEFSVLGDFPFSGVAM